MPKPDLGDKQTCPTCSTKFFDLHKRPAVCPKCGATFDPITIEKRAAKPLPPDPTPAKRTAEDEEEHEDVVEEAEEVEHEDEEAEPDDVPEIDEVAAVEPVLETDEDGEPVAEVEDDLPEGFEPDDGEPVAEAEDDLPFIEDDDAAAPFEEDEFPVDDEER